MIKYIQGRQNQSKFSIQTVIKMELIVQKKGILVSLMYYYRFILVVWISFYNLISFNGEL